jgi:cysteine synthase A
MKIYNSLIELIGHTPLVALPRLSEALGLEKPLLAKLESFNPLGSVKDRAALGMIEQAEKDGRLTPDTVIIEPTSGNTGIGLAFISVIKGYRLILTMPETMSLERRKLLHALGAEIQLTAGALGMAGAIERANELAAAHPKSFIPMQFSNPANPQSHVHTTAEEIWQDTDGSIDYFVACVGTGGTLMGVAQGLRAHQPDIKIIAVEPAGSPLLSGGKAGPHKIQGIGANFIPDNYHAGLVDQVLTVTDEEAYDYARRLGRCEGILAGISSGAAVCAAVKLAQQQESRGKNIVVLLPDTGERYLSTDVFE